MSIRLAISALAIASASSVAFGSARVVPRYDIRLAAAHYLVRVTYDYDSACSARRGFWGGLGKQLDEGLSLPR